MTNIDPQQLVQQQYRAIRDASSAASSPEEARAIFNDRLSRIVTQNEQQHGLSREWQRQAFTNLHATVVQLARMEALTPEERALSEAIAATGLPKPESLSITEAPSLYRAKIDPGATVSSRKAWNSDAVYSVACNLAKRLDRVSAKYAPVVSTADDGDLLIDFSKQQAARSTAHFSDHVTPAWIAQHKGQFLFVPGVAPDGRLVIIDRREPGNQSTLRGGMSGSGKSMLEYVDLHVQTLLLSPDELHLWLSDPHAGLSPYEGLPHLHGRAIETDAIGAIANAVELVNEMNRRKPILQAAGVDNIDDLPDRLWYALGKFDEFSGTCDELDLELETVSERWPQFFRWTEDKDGGQKLAPNNPKPSTVFVKLLSQIAKQGRKYGVHVDVIEQNPKADVLPTNVKSELVSIALRMKTGASSRVILDSTGAEKLLGKGDALLSMAGELIRVQVLLVDADYDRELRKKCASVRPSTSGSTSSLPDYWEDAGSTVEVGLQPSEVAEDLPEIVAEYLENQPSETLGSLADRVAEIVRTGSKSKARSEVFGITGGRRYSEAGEAIEYLLQSGDAA